MSNLTSTVKFDVVRGWPHGGAIEENFPPHAATVIKEGEVVELESAGTVKQANTSVPTEGGTGQKQYRMVIQGNDQSDANYVGKVVCLRGNFTVVTEKFAAASYSPGDKLTVMIVTTPGWLTKQTGANEQIVGEVEAYDSTAGTLTVAMKI